MNWGSARRIIRASYPPVDLFEDIAPPEDWELLVAAAARWDPRLHDTVGNLALVPPHRRVAGPTASLVMGAFAHVSPTRPSRFADGRFGAWYCGDRFEVALAETAHHFARFSAATHEPPYDSDFQELTAAIHGNFTPAPADCLAPDDWRPGQIFGRRQREAGADGICYPSVRFPSGSAAAVFWPDCITLPVIEARQLRYHWDGGRMTRYLVHGARAWIAYP